MIKKIIIIISFSLFCFTVVNAAPPVFGVIGEERLLNSNILVTEGEHVKFQVNAYDPDGDELVFSANNVPEWANFDNTTRIFSGVAPTWASDYESRKTQPGSYEITFYVTDGEYTISKTVFIYILDKSWTSKTVAELVKNRPISAGGDIGTEVELIDPKEETISSSFGGGKSIKKVTFGFVSQVPNIDGGENDWVANTNYAYLPVDTPAVENVGAVIEGGYAGDFGNKYLAEKACAELDIPVLIIDMDWDFTHGSEIMSKCNEKSIETGEPEYLFYSFSPAHFLRATDALVTVIKKYTNWTVSYDDFKVVFTGHSKFGKTCLKAAAVDPERVVGFMASGSGTSDSGATRILGNLQGASSLNPEASQTYLGTMMRYYTENFLVESQLDTDVKMLNVMGTDDSKNDPEEYTPKYTLFVTGHETKLANYSTGTISNAPHTTQTSQHSTLWIMWLAHCFLDRPLTSIEDIKHFSNSGSISVQAKISGEPTIKGVKVWATKQNDLNISAWNDFEAYTMTLSNGLYSAEIPSDSTAYFIEVSDEADGVDGLITSYPIPTDKNYPCIPQPPDDITNFQYETSSSLLNLSWEKPESSDFKGVVIRSSTEGYKEVYNGENVYDDNGTSTSTENKNQNIYFTAYTYDERGDYSSGVSLKACLAEKGDSARFDMETGILTIPEVSVDSESYYVSMTYSNDMDFYITEIGKSLCSESSATYDISTLNLYIPEVVVENDTYKVDMQYKEGSIFSVTDATPAE